MTTSPPMAPNYQQKLQPIKLRRRHTWRTLVGGSVILCLGAGIGAVANSGAAEIDAANQRAKLSQAQLDKAADENQALTEKNDALAAAADVARAQAKAALPAARAKAAQEYQDREATLTTQMNQRSATLDARQRTLNARKRALDTREDQVSGMERTWAANTIPGDGIFIVGQDVEPGLYKAPASPGCYYARMKRGDALDNIIDNNNVDGPVAFTVLPTDYSLELSGCADFHKVG